MEIEIEMQLFALELQTEIDQFQNALLKVRLTHCTGQTKLI
jgi:hypothetical protein